MSLTIRMILANCTRDRLLLARDVTIKTVTEGHDKGTGGPVVRAKTTSLRDAKGKRRDKPPTYTTEVRGLDSGKPLSRQYVEVACSCEDFVFGGWEYALNKRGAAQIRYGNGEPPVEKNPRLVPGACKHLIRLFDYILRSGK